MAEKQYLHKSGCALVHRTQYICKFAIQPILREDPRPTLQRTMAETQYLRKSGCARVHRTQYICKFAIQPNPKGDPRPTLRRTMAETKYFRKSGHAPVHRTQYICKFAIQPILGGTLGRPSRGHWPKPNTFTNLDVVLCTEPNTCASLQASQA